MIDYLDTPVLVFACANAAAFGDKIYDALHLRVAGKAKADKIHTSNKRDFTPFSQLAEIVKMF